MTYTKRLEYLAESYYELAQIYRSKNMPKEAKKWDEKYKIARKLQRQSDKTLLAI